MVGGWHRSQGIGGLLGFTELHPQGPGCRGCSTSASTSASRAASVSLFAFITSRTKPGSPINLPCSYSILWCEDTGQDGFEQGKGHPTGLAQDTVVECQAHDSFLVATVFPLDLTGLHAPEPGQVVRGSCMRG